MLPVVLVTALDPAAGARQGHRGRRRRLPHQADQPGRAARAGALAAAHQVAARRGAAPGGAARRAEPNARAARRASRWRQLERLGRLKRFFSPQLAELIVAGGADDPLKTPPARDHRGLPRPARLHRLHRDRRARGGDGRARASTTRRWARSILEHEGTLERFTGDGMMVFFNDPVPVPDPARARRAHGAGHARARRARWRASWQQARLRAATSASASRRAIATIGAHRLRGPLGLRRDRRRSPTSRRGCAARPGRPDPGRSPDARPARRPRRRRARGRARAQGLPPPGAGRQRHQGLTAERRRRRASSEPKNSAGHAWGRQPRGRAADRRGPAGGRPAHRCPRTDPVLAPELSGAARGAARARLRRRPASRRLARRGSSPRPAASWPMGRGSRKTSAVPPCTWTRSSGAPSPAISRSSNPRSSSWRST